MRSSPPVESAAAEQSSRPTGLTQAEVISRRARGQGNNVRLETSRTYGQIVRENVFTFINNILFVLGGALVVLGLYSDAIVSVGVVMVNVLVSVWQEIRAKRKLDQIALLTRPKACVIRDGVEQQVDPSEIVLGDVLVLRPGDQIVVDGELIGDGRVDVDESLLTGESDRIPKRRGDPVYSGSFCVDGTAYYEAQKVGADSLAHQITRGAQAFRRVYTPLQQQINLVIRTLVLIVCYFGILLAINSVIQDIPLAESVKMSVVIAGLVPNGLFLAIALAYAMGAVRIAGQGALVQQANAVESLSNVDMLCLDKTGTLTANRILFQDLASAGEDPAAVRQMLGDYAASTVAGNRTIQAIAEACPGRQLPIVDSVPFSSEWKWSALAFDAPDRRGTFVLGAPEMLRSAVRGIEALDATARQWTEAGWRVVLFAQSPSLGPLWDEEGRPRLPVGLEAVALVAFTDELRPEAKTTLRQFAEIGVQVKIISGDNPRTVSALARQAGVPGADRVVSGPELAEMDPGQFMHAVEQSVVFGRISPQQKERIIETLRKQGHYVAMIGDGVNDVLSLKKANLGVAMESGAQMTRSVADIILLNDSFRSLPAALREGQRILNGMQSILKIFMSRVLYVALLLMSTGMVVGFPFAPKQASLLALLTVGIPTIALAAWARPGVVTRRHHIASLLHFVLPATVTIALSGLMVYLLYLVMTYISISDANPLLTDAQVEVMALEIAQSALTVFTILCGLLLIPFVEPPTPFWAGGSVCRGEWRPAALTVVLFFVFVGVLVQPTTRAFFAIAPLSVLDHLFIGAIAIGWAFLTRWIWRVRLLERFLEIDLGLDEEPVDVMLDRPQQRLA